MSFGTEHESRRGAGEGNRTPTTSLEGWGSTVELRPRTPTIPGSGVEPGAREVFSNGAVDLSLDTEIIGPQEYVISLAGEVDLYTCPEFKEELLRVADEGAVHVIVDLTQTTFIDSTALGVLLRGVERLRRHDGGRLSVVCPDANIRRIFELTGLDRVFGVYGSRSQALAAAASA